MSHPEEKPSRAAEELGQGSASGKEGMADTTAPETAPLGPHWRELPPREILLLLGVAFVATLTLTLLHIEALRFAWYWEYWWFDWVMHFLGGASIALLVVWGWLRFPWSPRAWWGWSLPLSVVAGLGVAMLVWEAGEYVAGIALQTEAAWEPYPVDTTLDVVLGALGGWVVVVFSQRLGIEKVDSQTGYSEGMKGNNGA